MKTVRIAGIGCRKDKLDTLTYEALMSMALTTKEYKGKKDAEKLIDKELKKHGFSKAKKSGSKTKTDHTATSGKGVQSKSSKKGKADNKSGS